MTRAGLVAVVIGMLGMVACTSSATSRLAATSAASPPPTSSVPASTTAPAASDATGWLHVEPDAVMFLTILGDTALLGTSSIAQLSVDGLTVDAFQVDVSGTREGEQVLLSVAERTWSGRLAGSDLVLTIPRDSGELVDARFVRGSADEYNAAVRSLNERAATNQRVAAEMEAAAREEAAEVAAAEQQMAERDALVGRVAAAMNGLTERLTMIDPTGPVEFARAGLDSVIAVLDGTSSCEDALFEASSVTFEADGVLFEVENGRYAIDSEIDPLVVTLTEQVTALELWPPTDITAGTAAAGREALADAETTIVSWNSNLGSLEQAAIADTQSAIGRAEARCGELIDWAPTQP